VSTGVNVDSQIPKFVTEFAVPTDIPVKSAEVVCAGVANFAA
jgi:hypothetical protein